jgi:hypothetical protein
MYLSRISTHEGFGDGTGFDESLSFNQFRPIILNRFRGLVRQFALSSNIVYAFFRVRRVGVVFIPRPLA